MLGVLLGSCVHCYGCTIKTVKTGVGSGHDCETERTRRRMSSKGDIYLDAKEKEQRAPAVQRRLCIFTML